MSAQDPLHELVGSIPPSPLGEELAVYQAALGEVDAILRPLLDDARDRLLGGSALQGVQASVHDGRETQLLFSRFANAVLPLANSSSDGHGSIRTKDAFEAQVAWSRMLFDGRMPLFVIGANQHSGEKRYTDLLLTTPAPKDYIGKNRSRPTISMYECRTDDYERWRDLSDSRMVSDISYEMLRAMFIDNTEEYVPQVNAIKLTAGGKDRLVFGGADRRKKDLVRRGLIAINRRGLDRRELSGIDLAAFDIGKHLTGLAIDFNKVSELDGVLQAHTEGMLETDET